MLDVPGLRFSGSKPQKTLWQNSSPRASSCSGYSRPSVFLALALVVCLAAGACCFLTGCKRSQPAAGPEGSASSLPPLSDPTLAVLGRLDAPLELRFYSILDPASVSAADSAFSGRVDQLLSAYEQAGNGKLKVVRYTSQSNLKPNAPAADGIQAFNIDKGDPCYLGIALAYKGKKESLARLSPDYEPAVEADITRAIARLEDATQPVPAPIAVSQLNTGAVQQVKALIPDVTSVSVDDARRLIQNANLQELNAAKKETDAQVKEAEQRYAQAQAAGSEADQQAARQRLEQAQADQKEKLDAIFAKAAAQLEAFQQLKAATR